MSQILAKAAKLYKEKKYHQALAEISKFDKILQEEENVLIFAGNCHDKLGQKKISENFYKKAYRKNKQSKAAIINLALTYFEQNKYFLSKVYIKRLLEIDPDNYNAITLLGNIYKEKKQYEKSIKFYQKALESEKSYYPANINLAKLYYQKKNYSKAYIYAKKAAEKAPEEVEVIKTFAEISIEIFKPDEAVLHLEKIAKKTKSDCWIYNLLSQLYMQQKKYETAIKAGLKAIEISKGENSQHINFGYILYDLTLAEQTKIARKYASIWLKKYPKNSIVSHIADSILQNKKNTRNNTTYVREIFDAFADDFENILQHLNYNVPKIMEEELSSFFKVAKQKKMRILDAGCGTGLCGKYLKKYSKLKGLDGVDISEKMLSVAKRKNIYSRLYNQDLVSFLQQHKNQYNLINAADVITYFGDLDILFRAANTCLCADGRILFSASENNINKDNWYLHSSGRFLHSQKYIENILYKNGFSIEKITQAHLRNEGEKKVLGWILLAQKTK